MAMLTVLMTVLPTTPSALIDSREHQFRCGRLQHMSLEMPFQIDGKYTKKETYPELIQLQTLCPAQEPPQVVFTLLFDFP